MVVLVAVVVEVMIPEIETTVVQHHNHRKTLELRILQTMVMLVAHILLILMVTVVVAVVVLVVLERLLETLPTYRMETMVLVVVMDNHSQISQRQF
jgi:hypothetical protein